MSVGHLQNIPIPLNTACPVHLIDTFANQELPQSIRPLKSPIIFGDIIRLIDADRQIKDYKRTAVSSDTALFIEETSAAQIWSRYELNISPKYFLRTLVHTLRWLRNYQRNHYQRRRGLHRSRRYPRDVSASQTIKLRDS